MSNQTRVWAAARSELSIPAAGPNIPQQGTAQECWHRVAQDSTGQVRRAGTARTAQDSTGQSKRPAQDNTGLHRTEELGHHRRATSEAQPQQAGIGVCHVWFVQLSPKTTQAIPSLKPTSQPSFQTEGRAARAVHTQHLGGVCESPFPSLPAMPGLGAQPQELDCELFPPCVCRAQLAWL